MLFPVQMSEDHALGTALQLPEISNDDMNSVKGIVRPCGRTDETVVSLLVQYSRNCRGVHRRKRCHGVCDATGPDSCQPRGCHQRNVLGVKPGRVPRQPYAPD